MTHGGRPAGCAVITGASSGIGAATSRQFSATGWELVLVARDPDRLAPLAAELPGASTVAVDLTTERAPALVLAEVQRRWEGRLHLLINNAGSAHRSRFADGGYANVQAVMKLNFDAAVRLTEVLLPSLRAHHPSCLVNVASLAGRIATADRGAYSASKFALVGWSDALRAEERESGVHVATILPGFVATAGAPQTKLLAHPLTRRLVGSPDHVARAIQCAVTDQRPTSVVPRYWRLLLILEALAPALTARLSKVGA